MTNAQWVYMRQRQKQWIAAQVTACILIALHRKYGFGFDRCARIYAQIREVEAEYGMDEKKIRQACKDETLVNVYDIVTSPRKEKTSV